MGVFLDKYPQVTILAFPTDDFHQEHGSDEDIGRKIREELLPNHYDRPNFILFQKSSLARHENPIYDLLKHSMPQAKVKHNFYKYVIGRDGLPVQFFQKKQELLEEVEGAIRVLL